MACRARSQLLGLLPLGSLLLLVLGLARHNLHPLGVKQYRIVPIHFEVHILDYEGPDFVAESVGVEVTLQSHRQSLCAHPCATARFFPPRTIFHSLP